VQGGPHAALPAGVDRDLAIDGCGAGAGITAEWFAAAGLEVVIFEEGPLCSSRDFHQFESGACPALRQDSACRKTADKATGILQGRCGGGSTTINLTGSLRTPSGTLQYSREHVALPVLTEAAMLRWFERAERRLCFCRGWRRRTTTTSACAPVRRGRASRWPRSSATPTAAATPAAAAWTARRTPSRRCR
jgi:choline dehydrogenase-like flavoprotein